jgi:hypothetical protein
VTDLTPSIIGEMQFAVRAMMKKKQREYAKAASDSPNLQKMLERIERLGVAQEWLRQQEKQCERTVSHTGSD